MKLEFIRTQFSDPGFQSPLATVVEDPQSLLPQSEDDLHLFGKPIHPLWNLDSVWLTLVYILDSVQLMPIWLQMLALKRSR